MNGSRKRSERSRSRVTVMIMVSRWPVAGGWWSLEKSARRLRGDRLVSELQPSIDDGECLSKFAVADGQRRIRKEVVPAHEREQPFLTEELRQRRHLGGRTVERRQRFQRLPVPHQFDDTEQADRPHRPH